MNPAYDPTPDPTGARWEREEAEGFERGKQANKDRADAEELARAERATFDPAERQFLLSLVAQYVIDTGRLLGAAPAGRAAILRAEMQRASKVSEKLRGRV